MDAVEIKESRTDVTLLVATLICIASSSSIAHEYASRFLDVAIAFGTVFNIRAFSCAAHAVGLAVGFGAAAFLGQANISRLRDMRALAAFFLSQIGLFAIFYAAFALHAELAIVALQIPIAALSALFIAVMAHYVAPLPKGAVLVCIPLCIGIPVFIVQGVFGALETAPLAAAAIAHVGLLCVGLVCGSRFFRRQTANAPLKAESTTYSAQLHVENSNSSQHSPIRPWLLVWIVVFAYGAVFGFYHVIPLGLPTPTSFGVTAPIIRISSNLLGAGLAAALLISSFSSGPLNTSVIWNRFYRLVFPLAVLAGLLIPFTQAQGYLLSITCSETALYYFDMIIALGCIVICKTLHADATSIFAHAFFACSSGFIAGTSQAALRTKPVRFQTSLSAAWELSRLPCCSSSLLTRTAKNTPKRCGAFCPRRIRRAASTVNCTRDACNLPKSSNSPSAKRKPLSSWRKTSGRKKSATIWCCPSQPYALMCREFTPSSTFIRTTSF